ncbi:hypothetical protein GCM10023156_30420 [Novipirellula rosea]|uniref:Trypsin n=2 Tax=Novipirellula rosea TaxID=1031540 RepID=A0ABP8MVS4_9BACT
MLPFLYDRTVVVIDTKDKPQSQKDRWSIFSGTVVDFGERLLFATASHCIDNFENPTRFMLMSHDGRFDAVDASVIRRTIAMDNDRPDVGILELDRSRFQSAYSHSVSTIDNIVVDCPDEYPATVMGAPSEEVKVFENGIRGILAGFTTAGLRQDAWPKINVTNPFDAAIDIIARYPNDNDTIRDEKGLRSTLPDPHGLSGGGYWVHRLDTSGIWHPGVSQLAAIQSSWQQKHEYIRLTKIEHWLRLVYSHYPELRDTIACAFPETFRPQ